MDEERDFVVNSEVTKDFEQEERDLVNACDVGLGIQLERIDSVND